MRYAVPEMEIVEFEAVNICTTLSTTGPEGGSGGSGWGGDAPGDWGN